MGLLHALAAEATLLLLVGDAAADEADDRDASENAENFLHFVSPQKSVCVRTIAFMTGRVYYNFFTV